eukprot:3061255-Pyramimonas_sp.AAC.2
MTTKSFPPGPVFPTAGSFFFPAGPVLSPSSGACSARFRGVVFFLVPKAGALAPAFGRGLNGSVASWAHEGGRPGSRRSAAACARAGRASSTRSSPGAAAFASTGGRLGSRRSPARPTTSPTPAW